jgi:hypothetical protein
MGTFQTKTTLHEGDELIKAALVLVVFTDLFQVINLKTFNQKTDSEQ